jgi:Cu(I)/Ag(I) efflux system protein CusF
MKEEKAKSRLAFSHTLPGRGGKFIAAIAAAAIATAFGGSQGGAVETKQQRLVAETAHQAPGEGVVKGVNAEERKLQIAHGPIPAPQWPAITMAFSVAPEIDISGIKPGSQS